MAHGTPSDRIAAVLAPTIEALGLDVYDIEVTGSGGTRTLRVLVDRDGGVDLDAITAATEAIGPVLDRDPTIAAALPGRYLLEVSSPGLERPLRTPAHFRRALGSVISVKTRSDDGATRRLHGCIVGAGDDEVELDVDGARERVRYADITQARTVFEWGPTPKRRVGEQVMGTHAR